MEYRVTLSTESLVIAADTVLTELIRACPQLSQKQFKPSEWRLENLKTFYHSVRQGRGAALSLAKNSRSSDGICKDIRLVPNSYGVIYKERKETNLWEIYCMPMPRQRQKLEKKYKNLKIAPQRLQNAIN
ncbi:hypothetical protein P618_200076 [Holospora obtusa F1]|uniref:Uncharacterized protein n=1 Tax=Holospora obtusa F1 TaxID=1399147 RepID=W6TEK4_HOLOB|nr:hypothetical protein [Holospora obtusa]ETZ07733.1 hypothetical protein P618_200076 [Holospora obtusa F1]